jgi:leucyl aminopeptidase
MEIKVTGGSLQESRADTVIVNLFEGVDAPSGATAALDKALGGAIKELIANGDLHGKLGEVGVLYPRGAIAAKRVLVTGLGPAEKLDLETVRRAAAHAIKRACALGAKNVATVVYGAEAGNLKPEEAAQAVGDGSQLALYKFKAPGKKFVPPNEIESLTLVEADAKKLAEIESGARISAAVCLAVYLARDLVSLPPNVATPSLLEQTAEEIARTYGMKITVGDREWAAERKMGAFLAVAQAAHQPPRFIVMEHNAGRSELDTLVLVGKGITFDSGGISLKPSEKMEDMKSDMAGAAAVLSTMKVVGMLNLPLHVVAIAPCTENVPGGGGYHPADVLTASNGKTIEIISTDAEGRLILADALVYAQQFKPKAVVDLATLTGACVIALGEWVSAGLFTTDDSLRDKLLASGTRMHERLWPMPLWDDYYQTIVSIVADMANTGGRYGGVGSSAIFLKEFTDYPWAHLDIAGMALITKKIETPYTPWGATGYGVRLLVDFLRNW